MDFSQLEAFRVIAETGSLTKAAEQLHGTQPAMSAALKKLETELGVELFDRSPNRISLNKTGEIALIHVQALLRGAEQMRADLLSAAQRELSLSIAFCDPGVRWFSVPRFSVAHPDVRVEDDLYEGEEAAKLLAERVYDLVVTARPVEDSRVPELCGGLPPAALHPAGGHLGPGPGRAVCAGSRPGVRYPGAGHRRDGLLRRGHPQR